MRLRSSTAKYKASAENELLAEVIPPCALAFVVSVSPASGTDVNIVLPSLYLRVSAGTLLLISKILKTLKSPVSNEPVEVPKVQDHSDAWTPTQNSNYNFWFLNASKPTELPFKKTLRFGALAKTTSFV